MMPRAHTGEVDPTNLSLQAQLEEYRKGVDELMLDAETPFYDRLQSLFATQVGEWREWHSEPTIDRLQKAQNNIVGIGLVVGLLDADSPYTISSRVAEGRSEGLDGNSHGLVLTANFISARILSNVDKYWPGGYAASERSQPAAVVNDLESNTLVLAEAPTSERFADAIKQAAANIHIGDQSITESLKGDVLLQTAFVRAAGSIAVERFQTQQAPEAAPLS